MSANPEHVYCFYRRFLFSLTHTTNTQLYPKKVPETRFKIALKAPAMSPTAVSPSHTMKLFALLLSLAVFAAAEPQKCHNCVDFPEHSAEQHSINPSEWLDKDCTCKDISFMQQVIEADSVTVYCCSRDKQLRGWFSRAWRGIKKFFSNVEFQATYQRQFKK
jgi:hypothetical protein